ncbi:MAG: type IV secretion system protein [Lactobacillus sp.]|jgi:type IV secretory pathway component VirB8|nr:type IV secretion system protein [Lactobacillus sp.]
MLDIFHTIFKYREKESPDVLGYYPVRSHIRAMPERRYLWTSRALVIMACFSICINMMLASAIYLLIPQRRVSPKLYQINQYFSQLEQVQPAILNMPVTDLIVEQHLSEYIMLRYLITNDYDEIRERWLPGSKIYWLSSPHVYKQFADNDVEYSIMQFRKKSLLRDVEIDWIRPMARKVWQVQFRTIDYTPNNLDGVTNIWRATLRIAFVDIHFENKEDALKNPFGFMVHNYSLAYHGTPETSDHYLKTAKEMTEGLFQR